MFLAYWTMFAGAFFATTLPGALIPDKQLSFHQLVNTPPRQLLKNQLSAWLPWMLSIMTPTLSMAFYDPGRFSEDVASKSIALIANLISMGALGLYSLSFYYSIGPKSQRWQEGTAGKWYDNLIAFDPRLRLPIPRGLVPALTATARVFMLSAILVVTQIYMIQSYGIVYSLIPAVVFAAWVVTKIGYSQRRFDTYYYPTNAFYSEVFQRVVLKSAERVPVTYEAVYWVPHRWRSHTWLSLIQLDRVIPMGRFVGIGLFLLCIMVWQQIPRAYITAYLVLLLVAKNLVAMMLSRQDITPSSFRGWYQSKTDWNLTLFFVNIRWTLPIFLVLMTLGWLHPDFSIQAAGLWTALDVLLSFLVALCISWIAYPSRRERVHG